MSYPPYIRMMHDASHGTAMKLQRNDNGNGWEYWRSAGMWGIDFKEKKGKLFSDAKKRYDESMQYLDGKELVPITEEEWRNDNKGYV
jgi:hypothetical protein